MSRKTNVTRLLDSRGVRYISHDLPPEKYTALEIAERLNVSPDLVFKTIVITRIGPGKPILALVPAAKTVDLKRMARACGEKKVSLPTQKEAEKITGLRAGGISPLALLNRGFDLWIDSSALEHQDIVISGGEWGLQIQLPAEALLSLAEARTGEISAVE